MRTNKRIEAEKRKRRLKKYLYEPNIDAIRFCHKHGLRIYASAQGYNQNMVKLFVQKGEMFKPLDETVYDQSKEADVMDYTARVNEEYERIYLKMKDRV